MWCARCGELDQMIRCDRASVKESARALLFLRCLVFFSQSTVDRERAEREQPRYEDESGLPRMPFGLLVRLRQSDAESDEQHAVQPTDDGYCVWHAGKVFQRHSNAEQQEKRDAFDQSDGAKAADGCSEHRSLSGLIFHNLLPGSYRRPFPMLLSG